MKLEDLKQDLPYKWRVQSAKYGKANCVSYIDARDCQDLLDKVVGSENWQSIFYDAGGLLFCKVGIKIGDSWIWKSDTGSESNIAKDKGHVSDAFKRTCVSWGIGRFLYRLPVKVLTAKAHTNGKEYPLNANTGRLIFDKDALTDYINGLVIDKNPIFKKTPVSVNPNVNKVVKKLQDLDYPDKIKMNGRVLENLMKGVADGKVEEVESQMKKYSMTEEQENSLNGVINLEGLIN